MRKTISILFTVLTTVLLFANGTDSLAFYLTDTDQEKCYSPTGDMYDLTEISCNSVIPDVYGQDGHYTQAPKPSFADKGNSTVKDLRSGLTWQKSPDCQLRTWLEAKDSCENLVLGDQDDWRLPSRRELITIVDFSRWRPSLNRAYFDHCPPDSYEPGQSLPETYWSGTTIAERPYDAYVHDFRDGAAFGNAEAESPKTSTELVRCVRGPALPTSFFADNLDGTVTDTTTGLMWEKEHQLIDTDWKSNLQYCQNLSLANYFDWRLPNIRELETLIDDSRYKPSIYPIFGQDSGERPSSTTMAIDPIRNILPELFSVAFDIGAVMMSSKRNILAARCVRLGPISQFWDRREIETAGGVTGFHFIDPQTGWLVGPEETVYKTADGGKTWTMLHGGGWRNYSRVFFTDQHNGWVIANLYTLNGRGYIFHTSDAGQNWQEQITNLAGYFSDIFFINSSTGWLIGRNIAKTEDGGETWTIQETENAYQYGKVFFLDTNLGWVVGKVILKTEDGGNTWTKQWSGDISLSSVFFVDVKNGWATGPNGIILKTTNGGQTWAQQASGTDGFLNSVAFSDSRMGFIFGNYGIFLHTTDGGETWTREYSGVFSTVGKVQFLNEKDGFAIGGYFLLTNKTVPVETITTPLTPTGPPSGLIGTTLNYSTGGAVSTSGHGVQYLFDWGDGTTSGWLPIGQITTSKTWSAPGIYRVLVQSRCSVDNFVQSRWSSTLLVTISATQTDLALTMTGSPDPGTVGTNLSYLITVKNNGPFEATGVTVTDSLPSGVKPVSMTPSQGVCSGIMSKTCNLGVLSPGALATVTLVVLPTWAGQISNTAKVGSNLHDPETGNNSAIIMTMANSVHDSIMTRDLPDFYTPQVAVPVTISINPAEGTTVYVVEDTPPPGWSANQMSHGGTWDTVGNKVRWGPFQDGTLRILTYNALPPAGETGTKIFIGSATINQGSPEIISGDNSIALAQGGYHLFLPLIVK